MGSKLPLSAQVYIWAVVAAATGAAAYSPYAWQGTYPLPGEYVLVAVFVLLTAVATHFPLHLAPGYNVNVATAIQFASLLFFGPPIAVGLVGGGSLLGQLAARLRYTLNGSPQRKSWRNVLFNSAQYMLTTAAGGAVYYSVLPHRAPAPLDRAEDLWLLPSTALTMFLVNNGLVATVVGLQRKQNPIDIWLSTRRREILHEAGLFFLGLIAARTTQSDPWIPLVLVLPTAIIYLSTKRNVQLEEQTIAAVEALADLVDRRDQYTFEHSRRVAEYSQKIARAMRLPADEVEKIRLAARVHDLGKIGVPNEVLHKQGALTDDEWQVMRRHPEMGYEILAKFPEYREGRELVLAHHERYDGKGYPNGLDGDHMRLGAQIIAVADTLDAMTSDRPYRKALPMETALAELHRGRGTQFNPLVVDTLARLLAQDAHQQTPRLVPSAVSAA